LSRLHCPGYIENPDCLCFTTISPITIATTNHHTRRKSNSSCYNLTEYSSDCNRERTIQLFQSVKSLYRSSTSLIIFQTRYLHILMISRNLSTTTYFIPVLSKQTYSFSPVPPSNSSHPLQFSADHLNLNQS
jgi:hypothetical protein